MKSLLVALVLVAAASAQISIVHYNDTTCTIPYAVVITSVNTTVSTNIHNTACLNGIPTYTVYNNLGAQISQQSAPITCLAEGATGSRRIFCGAQGINQANSLAVPLYAENTCTTVASRYGTLITAPGANSQVNGWTTNTLGQRVFHMLGVSTVLDVCKAVDLDSVSSTVSTYSGFLDQPFAASAQAEICADINCSKFTGLAVVGAASSTVASIVAIVVAAIALLF